ncbi:MAG: 4Fe-4S binding protein, partial [Clostridia bacterium]|nr:4Fe-4S binding protein [Clostridia bacterium]
CVLNNIELKNGKPVWGKSCTHCMACINFCPTNAIEYGKHSIGLRRYTLTD